ncbi:MAG: alginate export family protein [Candidatus Omnitrophica bacterium]|nr:alginate export family protein [Candidatus Omnitrophota bacterium]
MTKRLILIALAILVGISSYAYAEVQNIKVSGDIQVQGVSRAAFTFRDQEWNGGRAGGGTTNASSTDSFFMSTTRVRLDADLTDNVSAVVRLLNQREWGTSDSAENSEIDLDLAYMTLKEFLYSPLTLSVGRQNLRFGNALIVGDPDTNMISVDGDRFIAHTDLSSRKAFDAIRATLDYSPLVVDLVFSKIDENQLAVNDDHDLYGMNACYDFGVMNTIGELYYFEKRNDVLKDEDNKDDIVRTIGIRAQSEPIENLTLNAEVAHQFGHYTALVARYPNDVTGGGGLGGRIEDKCDPRDAWAVQVGADYLFADLQYTPGVSLWYTYLSGDEDEAPGTANGAYTAWDPMFEDQGGGKIYNAIMAASNCHLINLKGRLKPMDDLAAALEWTHLRLDKNYRFVAIGRQVILSGVAGNVNYYMTEKSHIGDEIDLALTYDYTEDVQLGLNAGIFVPGDAFIDLDNNACDRKATQIIGSMKVTF